MRSILIVLFVIFGNCYAFGQMGSINTDRPDESEGTEVIKKGYYQFESGVVFEGFSNSLSSAYNPSILFRTGLAKDLEIRLQASFLGSKNYDQLYLEPSVVGIKLHIKDEDKYVPELAFLFSLSFPQLASEVYKEESIIPEFRVALAKSITDNFSVSGNLGAFMTGGKSVTGIYSLSLGYDFTSKFSGFGEVYGTMNNKDSHVFDAGLSYRIKNNIAIDISAGTGLSDFGSDFFIGTGISFRLPK